MLVLRALAALVVLLVGGAVVAFLVMRDRRYLRFALQVLKYGLVLALAILGLFALERLVPVVL